MTNLIKDGETFPTAKVTQVEVFPFKTTSKQYTDKHICGLATVVLNDQFVIRDLRIMESVNCVYVAYPSRVDKYAHDEYQSVANPIKRALREEIENVVLNEYSRVKD